MKQKVLLIGGSTAVGKSKFALELSNKLKIEIISADSAQVYKELNIGTAKPTDKEKSLCPHHLIDIKEAHQTFNAFDFTVAAKEVIEQISQRGNLPVLVGGTGFYMESLLYNYDFDNKQRSQHSAYDYKLFVLHKNREVLYEQIEKRVDGMLEKGLVAEVQKLKQQGIDEKCQCMRAIGYKEILSYMRGEMDYQTAIQKIKQNTRNYAKRQITWFKHMNAKWVDTEKEWGSALQEIVNLYKEYEK